MPAPSEGSEEEVRRVLGGPHPVVPPDLAARAAARGERMLHHRRTVLTMVWTAALFGLLVFVLWAGTAQPWSPPPSETTPPLFGW